MHPAPGPAALPLSRRRMLAIFGAAALTSAGPVNAASADRHRWEGSALGGDASLTLEGFDAAEAGRLIARARGELDRLESIFSLYRPHTALNRLNREGFLQAAPAELIEALSLCRDLHERTGGAFDPTVQAYWAALTKSGAERGTELGARADLTRERPHVGFDKVQIDRAAIRLSDGAKLTLNGIAQGIITDRIADILRDGGARHVLVNLGEFHAPGPRADGSPWQIGLRDPYHAWRISGRVALTGAALATSAGSGQPLGSGHHLFDPQSGASPDHFASVSVLAPRAALADGLSTALYVMPAAQALALAEDFGEVEARFTFKDGAVSTTSGWQESAV